MEECYHGGQLYSAIGSDYSNLEAKSKNYAADVLDAWYEPAPSVVKLLRETSGWAARTSPPPSNIAITSFLAAEYQVKPEHLLLGHGSSDLIYRVIPSVVGESGVTIVEPAYGEYRHVVEKILNYPAYSFCTEQDGFELNVERLLNQVYKNRSSAVVLVNPCNPTGKSYKKSQLLQILKGLPKETTLVIDETYSEYTKRQNSLMSYTKDYSNLCIFKSLSKTYASSGLRAAICVWGSTKVEWHKKRTPPYVIGSPTLMALYETFNNRGYYDAKIKETHNNRNAFVARLQNLVPEMDFVSSKINCVLLDLAGLSITCSELRTHLAKKGIFVRNIDNQGVDTKERFMRVSILSATDMNVIALAIREVLDSSSLKKTVTEAVA